MEPVLDRGLCLGNNEGSPNRVDDCVMMIKR